MVIASGSKLPVVTLKHMTGSEPQDISTATLCVGKTVVLFGVPGAFTPTCSASHVPGFLELHMAFKSKGVDCIACVSVNDVFVMSAWGQTQKVEDKILMLADGNAEFAKATGLDHDFSGHGLGIRSRRFAMVIRNGTVDQIFVEAGGALEVSSAEAVLKVL